MRSLLEYFLDRTLDVMSSDGCPDTLLEAFAMAIEVELPGCLVGINVLDKPGKTFRRAIFPSLPLTFSHNLENNVITGKRGSCGLGILTGKTIEVADVANDERFSNEWKALFAEHNLESLLSIPALTPDGVAQGSVAVIFPYSVPPTAEQKTFLAACSGLCAKICAYSRKRETTQLLLGELDHRIRNLFLTLGGIANLTIKRYPDPGEFRRVFAERLATMHRAHALAVNAAPIELLTLTQEMLAPYQDECEISIAGPRLVLSKEAASALALVIHELSTNAAKYGSLSRHDGRLRVEWSMTSADEVGAKTFKMTWEERGGPPVHAPTRKGYGTTIIPGNLRNALDGGATFFFAPEGFRCEIAAPFSSRLGIEVP
jgi:two-component sensor histidine kinase